MATSEEPQREASTAEDAQMAQQESEPVAASPVEGPVVGRKRPRLDLTTESRERKRGMFGILVGTLKKAKKEDRDRNASEAAKKRADIDRRLQNQLAEENDNVRRAEELKRDRQSANRKEEDLKLREMIYLNRRSRLPALANFLLTSDKIPSEDSDELLSPNLASVNPLAAPPRTHPPPLFYLPAVLMPAQAAVIEKRKAEVQEAAEKEWQDWLAQRKEGHEEVEKLRVRVEEEETKRRVEEKEKEDNKPEEDKPKVDGERVKSEAEDVKMEESQDIPASPAVADVEKGRIEKEKDTGREGDVAMAADGDDAVEY